MEHLEHKYNLLLVLVHNIWLSKTIFFFTNATNNNELKQAQGFVTGNPIRVASNCKGDFFSSWMLKNPYDIANLDQTLHFIHLAYNSLKRHIA
jgi:hypothetical protein